MAPNRRELDILLNEPLNPMTVRGDHLYDGAGYLTVLSVSPDRRHVYALRGRLSASELELHEKRKKR